MGQFIAFFPLCDCREDCDLGRDRILVQMCLVYRMKCRGQISSWGFAHWNLDDIQTTLLILLGFLWSKFLAHETSTLIFHFHINCYVFTPTPWQLWTVWLCYRRNENNSFIMDRISLVLSPTAFPVSFGMEDLFQWFVGGWWAPDIFGELIIKHRKYSLSWKLRRKLFYYMKGMPSLVNLNPSLLLY